MSGVAGRQALVLCSPWIILQGVRHHISVQNHGPRDLHHHGGGSLASLRSLSRISRIAFSNPSLMSPGHFPLRAINGLLFNDDCGVACVAFKASVSVESMSGCVGLSVI